MTQIAITILSAAAILFLTRLYLGPTVADRVVALDGLLVTVMSGILVAAANRDSSVAMIAVLPIALIGFVATGVLARYIERTEG